MHSKDPDGNGPAADIGQVEGGILAWHKDRQLLDTDGCAAVKNRRAMQEALPIHDSAKKRKWTTRRDADAALPAKDGWACKERRQTI